MHLFYYSMCRICNTTTWVCMFKLESNILCFLANGWRKVNLHKFHRTNEKATSTCHVNASILKIYLFYLNISFSWNPCKYIPIFGQHYFSHTIERFYIYIHIFIYFNSTLFQNVYWMIIMSFLFCNKFIHV